MTTSLQTILLKVIMKSLWLWLLRTQQEKTFQKNPEEYLLTRLTVYILDITDSCARKNVRLWAVRMTILSPTLIWVWMSCYVGVHCLWYEKCHIRRPWYHLPCV